jgi:hypothetical protein
MYWKQTGAITIVLLIIVLTGWNNWTTGATGEATTYPNTGVLIETVQLTKAELAGGQLDNLILDEAGVLMPVDPTAIGRYHSPTFRAPFPFNAVVPRWQADLPPGAEMELFVRTGNGHCDRVGAGCSWSDWYEVHAHGDWTLPGAAQQVGDMVFVNDQEGTTHTHLQFALEIVGEAALHNIDITFIDSSRGPTTAELLARQAEQPASESAQGYPKPAVIGRNLWCGEPACFEPVSFPYYPVSHLILHHTATSNEHQDWAAVVRAIWRYHAITLGWDDIGYHYLVDVHGNIYEGRQGGDDVVGAHAGPANTGSMAVAILGTFTLPNDNPPGIKPPAPMLNAVAELFAWKSDQRQIDVFDASKSLPNMNWGLPHLMGHRDAFGGPTTKCPGDQAHALLPWLRQEVASRTGFVSPYIYIDELSEQFSMSGGLWNVPGFGCGNNGHAFYAWSVTDPSQSHHWGEWSLQVPQDGLYEIQVHIPYCYTGAPETRGARYTITHAQGSNQVVIDQDALVGQWASLGTFEFSAGQGKLRLTNLTNTDTDRGVWFDAIRLHPLVPPVPAVALQNPAAGSWHNQLDLNFTWQITNPISVVKTRWQVATDSGFNNLLADVIWNTAVSQHNYTFDQLYPQLYWRVVLTPHPLTGLTEPVISVTRSFGFDQMPPESAVDGVYELVNGRYVIAWNGQDDLSGVAAYHIDYRHLDETEWTRWLTATPATAASFNPPQPGHHYAFRSQAIDQAGNVEPPHPQPDITTEQAILLSHVIMLPIVHK